ncbi:MAG: AI-2E family transporter [Limosilactobacillus gorillae]|jgi:predicted PurR-regulated permease PerM|uniref:AI-2E family transporter n=1 Tax=Limosilactobacillus gorillae TaxID=1450649 RepID=UPI000A8C5FE5|nr:AI-2E family transporter [Limosilactobacillus gorillae]MDO4855168.1 AI-2E family transporter [Limosilactobacillus gorillae]
MKKWLTNLPYLSLIGAFFVCYLVITYWPNVARFLGTIFSASLPLLIGCVIAYIVNLLMVRYESLYRRTFKGPRALKFTRVVAICLAYLSILVVIGLVSSIVAPQLIACLKLLFSGQSKAIPQFIHWLENESYFKSLWQQVDLSKVNWSKVQSYVLNGASGTLTTVMSTTGKVVSALTTTAVAIFFSIYVLLFKDRLAHQFKLLVTTYLPKQAERIQRVLTVFDQSFSSYIVGQVKDAVVLGCSCTILMLIFQLPYAPMIGAVTAVAALIPIIGAIMGASIGVIVIFAVSPIKALIFLVMIICLQEFDNRITYPLIVGKSIGLPSVWVFVAVMVGGGVSGIFGMMFTVPLFAAFYQLLKTDVANRQIK